MLPPPYRVALGVVYSTTRVEDHWGTVYKVDTAQAVQPVRQLPLDIDVSGRAGSATPELISILNLDDVQRKVAYTLDDEAGSSIRWCAEHHAMSGFGFWDETDD